MTLKELTESITGAGIIGDSSVNITGLHYDSRRIKPGMLFIAITGYKQDGKQFIADAVKNGAAALLTDVELDQDIPVVVVDSIRQAMSDLAAKFYDYPGKKLQVIGVTGTNGKSTSVYLLKKIIEQTGCKVGMLNSLTYDTVGNKYKAERTTPDSIEMQQYLAEMLEAECKCAVVEVSSHALVLNRVDNIEFKLALFTNISRDHLDFHKTMEQYLEAKKLLLGKLNPISGQAVVNKDIPEFGSIINEYKGDLITYSTSGQAADLIIESSELSQNGTTFRLRSPLETADVHFKLPGRYNMENALSAAAAGYALSIDLNSIKDGLEAAEPLPGRFQPVNLGQPFSVLIDFAHTPDAIERLCLSAQEISNGRILTLFGCGGDRDPGKRPMMAKAASKNSDFVILTADNPRTEDPQKIFDETLPGMVHDKYKVIMDRGEAVAAIIEMAEENDVVLIAGKGAEEYQEIGKKRLPYSDKLEILKVLGKLGYKQVTTG